MCEYHLPANDLLCYQRMRILHTGDFHAGKNLRGLSRTPEIREALREISQLAHTEKVDALLIAGDLFDTANPTAEAENAIFEFFIDLKEKGIPSVAIAGNHDSARRLSSLSGLLGWVGASVVAEVDPKSPLNAVKTLYARDGTPLKIAALPYLSERRLIKHVDLLGGDVSEWRLKYQEGMRFFIHYLTQAFSPESVNVLMMHTTIEGSHGSGSESHFKFDMGNTYTVPTSALPTLAQYVALGHIHKAQCVVENPPSYYAGSPLQLDFGEAGDAKSVYLVELDPGRPAHVHPVALSAGRPLKNARLDLDQLDHRMAELESFPGWVKVILKVPPGAAVSGIRDRILQALPNVIGVELDREDLAQTEEVVSRKHLSTLELFERFYAEKRGDLPDTVRQAFIEGELEIRQQQGETV